MPLFAQPRVDPVVHPTVSLALKRSTSQTVPIWVFFTDKGIMSMPSYQDALSAVAAKCHPRALRRRSLRRVLPGLFDHHDLPLVDEYVTGVLATGARLRTKSEWLNAVSVEADEGQINAIAALPFVRLIRPVSKSVRVDPPVEPIAPGDSAAAPTDFYGNASAQLHQINIPAVHAAGYSGAGIIIGILDTGFVRTHEAFNEAGHGVNVLGEWDFINNDGNTGPEPGDPSSQHRHGTLILGTIGAYKPNVLVGGAYDASFYLAKTEDVSSETPIEEDFYVSGLQWLEANGADVATSSLGYIDWYTQSDLDGQTAVTTVAVNIATANGLVCCTAGGNSGHDADPGTSHLIAPADALEVLTCGAVWSDGSIASFSSDGPTADGRVKPEVLARGVSTATVDPDNGTNYVTASGTSLSTPLLASAAALVVQAHPNWSVSQIRTALTHTADGFVSNGTYDSSYVRGYGVIDVLAAIQMNFLGDFDGDGDVDIDDFTRFEQCFTGAGGGPLGPNCGPGDFDADNDIDCDDWAQFVNAWTAPQDPPQLTLCAIVPTGSWWALFGVSLLVLTAATVMLGRQSRGDVQSRAA